jgi:hypothetical protein
MLMPRLFAAVSVAMLGANAVIAADVTPFEQSANQVRTAMAQRDFDGADSALVVLAKLATSDGDREVVNRLAGIQDRLTRFWESVNAGGKRMTGTEEIEVGGSLVAFVEYVEARKEVALKVRGEVRRYTPADMPIPIAAVLSDYAIKKGSAASNELLGAVEAMDAKGDRAIARKLWADAQRGGAETGPLLAELDVPLPGAARVKVPRVTPAVAAVLNPRQWSLHVRDGDDWKKIPLGDNGSIDDQKRLEVNTPADKEACLVFTHKLPPNFAVRFYFLSLPDGQTCGVFTGGKGDAPFAAAVKLPPDTIEIELSRAVGKLACKVNGEECAVNVIDDKAARAQGLFGISLPAGSRVTVAGFEKVTPGKAAPSK